MAVCKVPADAGEAIKSSLLGMWEKKRVVNMYKFIFGVNPDDKGTWNNLALDKVPMKDVYASFSLEENTIDFLGHAVALQFSDNYLFEPALDSVMKMQLYLNS